MISKVGCLNTSFQVYSADFNKESFWFAEVLKYLYLIFTSETEVGVQRSPNQWVFNTEAHPLKVRNYRD